ncbi:MAG: enoyl-CoA hydratase/isomerase family protein, partial [Leptothrix sp. (in: b-proteobacteria)]
AGAPLAARLNKRALRALREAAAPNPFDEAQRAALAGYADGADHREGISAFLAKRAPRFGGS